MTPDQQKALNFLKLIDQYKNIFRLIYLDNKKRLENDAEHSWHLAMMVWIFAPFYETPVNLEKCIKMALMHDLVEIYAGDVHSFDEEGRKNKKLREDKAAIKLFAKLPQPLKTEFKQLWVEYEDKKTAEAIFTQAIDKLHPLLQNTLVNGSITKDFHVSEEMARTRMHFNEHSSLLKNIFEELMQQFKK